MQHWYIGRFPEDPFYSNRLTLIPAWISVYIHYIVWDESIYLYPNFNTAAVEVRERISNFITHFTEDVIIYAGIKIAPRW